MYLLSGNKIASQEIKNKDKIHYKWARKLLTGNFICVDILNFQYAL